jgi:hypothetical protein
MENVLHRGGGIAIVDAHGVIAVGAGVLSVKARDSELSLGI